MIVTQPKTRRQVEVEAGCSFAFVLKFCLALRISLLHLKYYGAHFLPWEVFPCLFFRLLDRRSRLVSTSPFGACT